MRRRISEVTCNQCGAVIGHYVAYIDYMIRDEGGIVRWYGDFCDQKCLGEYMKKRQPRGKRPDGMDAKSN